MATTAPHSGFARSQSDRSGLSATTEKRIRWDKRMSNHCAFALLVYTMLQIFMVVGTIPGKGMSVAPYLGLLVLVAIIIPFCRKYEKRWEWLQDSGLSDAGLAQRYRIDTVILWVLALGLPFLFVVIFKTIGSMIG
jgi:hypothetical protein